MKQENDHLKIEVVPSCSSIIYLTISFSMVTKVGKSTLHELSNLRNLD